MGAPKGHPKWGGRQKGTTNKLTRDVQEFVDEIFKRVDPFDKIEDLLRAESPQVQAGVIDKLMQYRFGKPKESIELSGELSLSEVIQAARKRRSDAGS